MQPYGREALLQIHCAVYARSSIRLWQSMLSVPTPAAESTPVFAPAAAFTPAVGRQQRRLRKTPLRVAQLPTLDVTARSVAAPVGATAELRCWCYRAAAAAAAPRQAGAMLMRMHRRAARSGRHDTALRVRPLLHQDIHLSELHPDPDTKEAYVASTRERAGVQYRTCSWLVTPRESCWVEHSCT
jgi:hypothetical protein